MQSKKIIFIFILSIIFMFLLTTKIFAVDYTTYSLPYADINNVSTVLGNFSVSVPQDFLDYDYRAISAVCEGSHIYCILLYSDDEFSYNSSTKKFYSPSNSIVYGQLRHAYTSNPSLEVTSLDGADNNYTRIVGNNPYISTSNFTIQDNNENVLFQVASGQNLQDTTLLAPIVEQIQMKGILAEVVALLPTMMMILVSLLAFYKAWQVLLTFLRTS